MRKLFTMLTVIMLIIAMTTGMCFAAEGKIGSDNVIKVMADIEGFGHGEDVAGYDFTITDELDVYSDVSDSILEYESLVITNNAKVGQLLIESLEVTPRLGWVIKADDEDYFANLRLGTKEFSLVCEGHDFSTEAVKSYGKEKMVRANSGTQTFEFTGHMGPFRTDYTGAEIAEITVTVSLY
ncbi:MAG: hypothetical protein IJB73_03670 [Firmicutes bacterium]|nr:hypothetical protein [Bacillota bacterium]